MRIDKEVELRGEFWLPGRGDSVTSGVLRIADGGAVTLETVYSMHSDSPLSPRTGQIERIVGRLENGSVTTLDDCFFVNWRLPLGPARIHVGLAIIGLEYGQGERISLIEFRFTIEGLFEWLSPNDSIPTYSRTGNLASISWSISEDRCIELEDGIVLALFIDVDSQYDTDSSTTISQHAGVRLTSTHPVDLPRFQKIAFMFTNLLRLAHYKPVSIRDVYVLPMDVSDISDSRERERYRARLYFRSRPYSVSAPLVRRSELLFSFDIICNHPCASLHNWFRAHAVHHNVISDHLAVEADERRYLEDRFLAVAMNLEAFHRCSSAETRYDQNWYTEWSNEIIAQAEKTPKEILKRVLQRGNDLSLPQRLQRLMKPFSVYFGSDNERHQLACRAVNLRNTMVHSRSAGEDRLDMIDLYNKLEALLRLHLLMAVGLSADEVTSIAASNGKLRHALGLD